LEKCSFFFFFLNFFLIFFFFFFFYFVNFFFFFFLFSFFCFFFFFFFCRARKYLVSLSEKRQLRMVIWYDTIRYVYGRGAQQRAKRGEARRGKGRGHIYNMATQSDTNLRKKKKGKEERRRRGKGITIFDRYGERKTERTNTLSPLKRALEKTN